MFKIKLKNRKNIEDEGHRRKETARLVCTILAVHRQVHETHLRVRTKDAFIFRCNVYSREECRRSGKRKWTHMFGEKNDLTRKISLFGEQG